MPALNGMLAGKARAVCSSGLWRVACIGLPVAALLAACGPRPGAAGPGGAPGGGMPPAEVGVVTVAPQAIGLIDSGTLDLAPLVSDVLPLARVEEGLAALRSGRATKVVITP